MKISSTEELKGCVRDNIPCKFLITSLLIKPLYVKCSIGQECCRGYCCFHLDDNKGKTIDDYLKERESGCNDN